MSKPVIFLAFANDADRHLDLLKAESRGIFERLRELDQKEYIKVHREESATLDELFNDLIQNKDQVAIFHYGGHANSKGLGLEGGAGAAQGLAQAFGAQSGLKLVFLNGCSTRKQVQGLMDAGVPAVIATSVPIEDKMASDFAMVFYRSLARHLTIGQAFTQAWAFLKASRSRSGDSDTGIVTVRDIEPDAEDGSPEPSMPWGLYVRPQNQDEILDWKLPYARIEGLPQDMRDYIGSFPANNYIMLTLDEMIRYNPDLYEQMIERRGNEEVKKDSKYMPELIIRNFPWPIGSQIRLLRQYDAPDQNRLEHLISTYVRTTQLLYCILLSDLWEKSRRGIVKKPAEFTAIQPKTVDEYLRCDFLARIPALHDVFRSQHVAPFVPEFDVIAKAMRDEGSHLAKAHADLEQRRASVLDGPPKPDLAAQCRQAEMAVAIVLRHAAFLVRYRMLTVRSVSTLAPRFEEPIYEMDMGPLNAVVSNDLSLYQDPLFRRKPAFSSSHSVVLVSDEERMAKDDCLNLSPFVMDKNTFAQIRKGQTTESDKLAHIFMLAWSEADRLVYLSVNHGVFNAGKRPEDLLHTRMTQADFAEGRNVLGAQPNGSDFDNAIFGLSKAPVTEEGPAIFGVLEHQFGSFQADMMAS